MRLARLTTTLALIAGVLHIVYAVPAAQAPILQPLPPATFEVSSVKRNVDPEAALGVRPITGSRFTAVATVRMLIQVAYGYPVALLDSQIVGGPAWAGEDRFEVVATIDGAISDTPGGPPLQLFAMMRALLADRFRLQLSEAQRVLPIYELLLDQPETSVRRPASVRRPGLQPRLDPRLGPRLRPADGQCVPLLQTSGPVSDFSRFCGFKNAGATGIAGRGLTLEELAGGLAHRADVQRVVRNRTGLAGTYDVDLQYTPFNGTPAPDGPPALFTAIKEQLGLQLRPATGPVDVLVIDRVEPPSPD